MDTLEVRHLGPAEYPCWDRLVGASENGTIFHTSGWIVSAGCEPGVRTAFFGAFSHDQLVGGCAIHSHTIAGLFTSATTDLPLTPYGGVMMLPHESSKVREREQDERLIIRSLLSAIQEEQPHTLSLTMSPAVRDIRPYTWNGWDASVSYCYIFSLLGPVEGQVSRKVRWSVRKAQKSGMVSRQHWDKDLFLDLTLNTWRKQGREPPYSRDLLFSLMDTIQKNQWGEMWVAETPSGEVAAAEIITWDHRMAYLWAVASHDLHKGTGANSLLLFEMLTHLQTKGFRHCNLMSANTANLTRFVTSFNPELVPYYSVQKSRGLLRIFDGMRSMMR